MSAAPNLKLENKKLNPLLVEIGKKAGVDLTAQKKWSKKMASGGFALGFVVAYSPIGNILDKLPLDKIPMQQIPVLGSFPGGAKVLVAGGILALCGFLIGQYLENANKN